MCVVSYMGDYWKDQFPLTPSTPSDNNPGIYKWWDGNSFALLQQILQLCKKLDEKMDQKDCEQDSKIEYFKKVAEKLGMEFNLEEKTKDLSFGKAIELLKEGKKVSRVGWNGKGMYLELQVPDKKSKMSLPYIFMKTADNNLVPWLASQSDMLANDWEIV